ncbi:MAG: tetratricopeptide repeat protein [Methanosarcinaceae archaeon]|nr:tetratricopeptide repeat protein [Methanosarcinaceae archaeon]
MYLSYARAFYSKALAFLNLKKYAEARASFEKALEAFERALKINPEDSRAWYYKGNTLSYLNRPEEALLAFEKALRLEPAYSQALYCKGLALGYLNRPAEALKALEKVLEENEKDAGAWYYLGLALYNLKRYEEALKAFSQSLEIEPENPGALYYKGLVLHCLKQPEEALKTFEATFKLDPAHAGALREKAKILEGLGKPEKALKTFEAALELEPGVAEAWAGKGEVLANQGKTGKALEAFEKALELEAENADFWNKKGKALVTLERYGEAFLAFEKALNLKQDFSEALANRGSAFIMLGNFEAALEAFELALKLEPVNFQSLRGKGNALFGLGNFKAALELFEEALCLNPKDAGSLCGKGSVFLELGKMQEALKAFEAALELDASNSYAWSGKGNALCEMACCKAALKAYEELLGLENESLLARYNKGVALSRLRKKGPESAKEKESGLQTAFSKYLEYYEKVPEEKQKPENLKFQGLALAELGEYSEALKTFEKALALGAKDAALELNRGLMLLYMNRSEKAFKVLEKAKFSKNSHISEAGLTAQGFALISLKRYKAALKTFGQIPLEGKDREAAWLGEGLVFSRLGEWKKVLETFEKAPGHLLKNPNVCLLKAFAFLRLGEYEKVAESLEPQAGFKVYGDFASLLLGFAATRLGRTEEAFWAYRQAVAANPKNVHAHNGLAALYFKFGDNKGALKELEASIAGGQENEFARGLKARLELEEQAYGAAAESFGKALFLSPGKPQLLLWEAYANYLKAEVSFQFRSPSYKHTLLSIIRKLEESPYSKRAFPFRKGETLRNSKKEEIWEMQAHLLYFTGFFYYRLGYFKKAAEKLKVCLRLLEWEEKEKREATKKQREKKRIKEEKGKKANKTEIFNSLSSWRIEEAASKLLKELKKGPLHPSGLNWWLASPLSPWPKRAFFGLLLFLASGLLLSFPALDFLGLGFAFPDWKEFGGEYSFFLLSIGFILLFPGSRKRKEPPELELEVHKPPFFEFEIPDEILDQGEKKIGLNLLDPELMKEKIGGLERYLWISEK